MDCGFRVAWLRKTGADCASREQHRVRRCLPLIYLADFVQNNFVYTSKRRREPPVTPKGDKKKEEKGNLKWLQSFLRQNHRKSHN